MYASDVTYTYVTPVENLIVPGRDNSVSAKALSVDELLELSKNSEYELSEKAARYVEAVDQYCYATFHQGTISSYIFLAAGHIDPKYNNAGVGFGGIGYRLPLNVVYAYKCFCLPRYRGQSHAGVAIAAGVKALVEAGGWLVMNVDVGNHSSIRMMEKLGLRRHNKCREYRVLNRGKYFIPNTMSLGESNDANHKRVEVFTP